jgi:hypothetical protein
MRLLFALIILSSDAYSAPMVDDMGRTTMLTLFSVLMVCYIAIRFKKRQSTHLKPMDMKSLIEPKYTELDVVRRFFRDSSFPTIFLDSDGNASWMNSDYKKLNQEQDVFDVIVKTAFSIERNGSKVCFVNQKPYVLNKFSFMEQMAGDKVTVISLLPTVSDYDFSSAVIPNISDEIIASNEGDELNNLLVETLKNVNYLFQVSGIIVQFDSSQKDITTNINAEQFVKQFSIFFQSLVDLLVEQKLNKIIINVDEVSSRSLIDIRIPNLNVSNFQQSHSASAGKMIQMMSEFEALMSAYYFKANFRVHRDDLALQLSFNSLARHELHNSNIS